MELLHKKTPRNLNFPTRSDRDTKQTAGLDSLSSLGLLWKNQLDFFREHLFFHLSGGISRSINEWSLFCHSRSAQSVQKSIPPVYPYPWILQPLHSQSVWLNLLFQ